MIRGTLLAIENMQGGGGGVIINMGSTSGEEWQGLELTA